MKWQFKSLEQNTCVEKELLVKMSYIKIVRREDEQQAAMAVRMTKQLTQPSEISACILSRQATRRSTS